MFSQAKRQKVWNKTAGHCWYCGKPLLLVWNDEEADDAMTVDHQTTWRDGGTHHLKNLVPACRLCNRLKSSHSLEEYRSWISRRTFPQFTQAHLDFLQQHGVVLPPHFPTYPPLLFWWEEQELKQEAET